MVEAAETSPKRAPGKKPFGIEFHFKSYFQKGKVIVYHQWYNTQRERDMIFERSKMETVGVRAPRLRYEDVLKVQR